MDRSQIEDAYKFRKADDSLITSGQPTEEQLASAAHQGFQVVINLAFHDNPSYSLKDEPGTVQALGMEYVHIPVPFEAPSETELLLFFEAMTAHQGRKVLVHCAANKRVTAFLGLYRVMKQGWAVEPAFAPMTSVWEPDPVWSSFIAAMLAKAR
ncbi:MAG: protein tyrosine phosphatase family protein [Panacagrimonas sp.]